MFVIFGVSIVVICVLLRLCMRLLLIDIVECSMFFSGWVFWMIVVIIVLIVVVLVILYDMMLMVMLSDVC